MISARTLREFLFHVLACSFFVYTDLTSILIPGHNNTYGGRYKFATVISLKLVILYYGYSAGMDLTYIFWSNISKSSKVNRQKFRKNCLRRDYVFSSLLFPLTCTVVIMFWGLFLINPELVQSARARELSPTHGFHNHAVHTAPIIFSLLECVVTKHRLSIGFKKGCIGWVAFFASYLGWIFWIAHKANIWVYPFLKVLSTTGMIIFFTAMFAFEAMLYQIGAYITRKYWKIQRIGDTNVSEKLS